VEKGLTRRLAALMARMEEAQAAGIHPNQAWLRQEERYRDLRDQVRALLADYAAAAEPTVARTQRGMVAESLRATPHLAAVAAGPVPDGATLALDWNRLPRERIESLIGFAGDGSPLRTLLDSFGRETGDALLDTLINGIAAGEGPREIARRFRAEAAVGRARAENIVRTESLRAAREAQRLTLEENASVVTGYRRLSARDNRVCAACWALDGKVYPTSERFPSHPSCRCVMVPVLKSWAEITGDPQMGDTRPDPPTGPEVFAGLSDAEKREILGPEGYGLLQSGEVSLEDFAHATHSPQWGPGVRAATIQQARANAAARPF
jgi:SPP1 gp7 family putative phage head morphogenesis protein